MEEAKKNLSQLEIARIMGEPRDPRKPYSSIISSVCEVDSADPEEYVYYFDALMDTDKVYVITSSGAVTQENVVPDQPALITFFDIASPEYYVKFIDLAKAKEKVLARKTATINRAMNSYENYKVIGLIDAAVQTANQHSILSGATTFNYPVLVDMMEGLRDYADNFTLLAGTQIAKDIALWEWTEDRFQSMAKAFGDLGVEVQRINQNVTIDGGATAVLASTKAYLVGRDTEMGKPIIWVRKKLDSIKLLGGVLNEAGDMPERLIFASPNPITVTGSARYLATGLTGFEEAAAVVTNPYALAYFNRA